MWEVMFDHENVEPKVDVKTKIKPKVEFKSKSIPIKPDNQYSCFYITVVAGIIIKGWIAEIRKTFFFSISFNMATNLSNVVKKNKWKFYNDHSQINMVTSSQNLILKYVS